MKTVGIRLWGNWRQVIALLQYPVILFFEDSLFEYSLFKYCVKDAAVKKFKRILIEISNVCNLSCTFCPPTKRKAKAMSASEFDTVLTKLKGHGDHIYLHVKGEPLFHPEFEEILDLCDRHQKIVNITTNGTLLDTHGDAILKSASVRLVNISLQSFETVNDQDAYKKYLNKVVDFVKRGSEETEKLFEFRLWNLDEADSAPIESGNWALRYIQSRLGRTIPVTDQKTKSLSGRSTVYISKGFEFEWPSLESEVRGVKGTCHGLRRQIAILSTGDVVPCCMDAEGIITLGNVFETDFETIVTSKRAKAIRVGFENNKIVEPLCARCMYRECFAQ